MYKTVSRTKFSFLLKLWTVSYRIRFSAARDAWNRNGNNLIYIKGGNNHDKTRSLNKNSFLQLCLSKSLPALILLSWQPIKAKTLNRRQVSPASNEGKRYGKQRNKQNKRMASKKKNKLIGITNASDEDIWRVRIVCVCAYGWGMRQIFSCVHNQRIIINIYTKNVSSVKQ